MRRLIFPTPTVPDDRDASRDVLWQSLTRRTLSDARFQDLRRAIDQVMQGYGLSMGIATGLIAAFLIPVLRGALSLPNTWVGSLAASPVLIVFVLILKLVLRGDLNRRYRLVGSLLLREGLCGTCGYNLHQLVPEADGCIVCPECGAAWKRMRIAQTSPLDDRPLPLAEQLRSMRGSLSLARPSRLDRRIAEDDRQLPVQLMGLSDLRLLAAAQPSEAPHGAPAALAAIHEATRPVQRTANAVAASLVALGVLGIALSSDDVRPYFLIPTATVVVVYYFLVRSGSLVRSSHFIAAVREAGICPACGRGIDDLPLADDRCRECECGAAWRGWTCIGMPALPTSSTLR